jgi:hypothetical protein
MARSRFGYIFPTDFEDWAETAWICDPWANIACAARDYPQRWTQKMNKWSFQGKRLVSRRGPFSPADRDWITAVGELRKGSWTW